MFQLLLLVSLFSALLTIYILIIKKGSGADEEKARVKVSGN